MSKARRSAVALWSAALLLLSGCSQDPKQVARQLLEELNQQQDSGFSLTTDLDRCTVTPAEEGRYLITFRDAEFTTDLTRLVRPIMGLPFNSVAKLDARDPTVIEEMTLLYGPDDGYLEVIKTQGLRMQSSYEEPEQMAGLLVDSASFEIGELITTSWDISDLIRRDARAVDESFTVPFDSGIEDLRINFSGRNEHGDRQSLTASLGTLSAERKGNEDTSVECYLYNTDVQRPDLGLLRQKGIVIADIATRAEGISIAVESNGESVAQGSVQAAGFDYYLRPDREREHFEAGARLYIRGVDVDAPGSPLYEMLSGLQDLELTMTMQGISDRIGMILLDLLQALFTHRSTSDTELQQLVMQHAKMMAMEASSSPPVITLAIPSLRHSMGELNAQARFVLHPSSPQLEAQLTILQVDACLQRLEESELLSRAETGQLAMLISTFMLKDESGNARITIESLADQPGVFLVNGVPMRLS